MRKTIFITICMAALSSIYSSPCTTAGEKIDGKLIKAEKTCPTSVVLYYAPYCPHSMRVVDFLDEQHLKVEMKDVSRDAAAKEELRTLGGQLMVPCLIIDRQPLYDDSAIIQWMENNRECLDLSTPKAI